MWRGKEGFVRAGVRAGLAVATAVAALPLRHIEISQLATNALLGNEVGCAEGIEPANPAYQFDAIAVLGAGQLPGPDGQPEPSYFGAIRLDAAAWLYEKDAPIIIVPDGKSAAVEINYLQQAYQEINGPDQLIPAEALLLGEHAINTATEMREIASIMQTHGLRRVLLLTNEFHTQRSVLFACANGIAASAVSAEEVIVEYTPERAEEFEDIYRSPQMAGIEVKETVEIALFVVDPQGVIPTTARRFIPVP